MTTISKVAERAGVSRTTVSHVLNHADRVSETLRERVLQAVAELGYVPNPHARSLRTGKTNMVAILIPDIANPFYPELVLTAQAALEAAGLDTMIFNSDVPGGHPQEHSREYLRRIRSLRVDGLIVGDFALHGMHDALLQIDVPAVFVGRLPNRAVDNVQADDFGGGYADGPLPRRPRASARRPCHRPALLRRGDAARRRLRARTRRARGRRPIRRCASREPISRHRAWRRWTGCSSSMAATCPRRSSSPTT